MGPTRSPLTEEMLLRHAGLVRSVARALVGPELAEDVVQDTMLAALDRPPGEPDRIRGWMARVARNLALRARRGRARRVRRERASARADAAPSAAEVAARLETEARLVAAIRALPEPYRTVVVLRYQDGLGPTAIAARTDVPVRTVESRLRRALERLRVSLDESPGGRRAWTAALIPFLDRPAAAASVTAAAGTSAIPMGWLLMSAKLKLVAGLAVVLVAAAAAWQVLSDPGTAPEEPGLSGPPALDGTDGGEVARTPPRVAEENATVRGERASPPEPGPRGTCAGGLSFEDGSPVAGEQVWFWDDYGEAVWTDRQGRYRIEGLVEDAPRVLMLGPRSAALSLGEVALVAGREVRADFTVADGVTLEIRVGVRGAFPPEGVRISLLPSGGEKARPVYARATGESALRLHRLARTRFKVHADAEGFRPHRDVLDLTGGPPPGPYRIDLEPADRLTLTVRGWPEGAAAPVTLMLNRSEPGAVSDPFHFRAKLGGDGTAVLTSPPPGAYLAFVYVGGLNLGRKEVVVREGEPTALTVDAPQGAAVSGRLVEEDGSPGSGRVVLLGRHPTTWWPSATVRKDGSFEFPLVPAGTYGPAVDLGDQVLERLTDDLRIGAAGYEGLRLVLPRGGSIEGRLIGFASSLVGKLRSVILSLKAADGWRRYGHVSPAYDGRFRAERLPAGLWRLEVEGSPVLGEPGGETAEVDLGPGEKRTGVEIRRREPIRVRLRLLDAEGAPFTEAAQAMASREGSGPRLLMLRPDGEGRVAVEELTPGKWTLTFVGGPKGLTVRELEVLERNNSEVTLRLW